MENKYVGILTEKGIVATKEDYDFFIEDETNRDINENNLKILKNDMNPNINEIEYPFMCPIVVYLKDGKGLIQQGHHRFRVCKECGRNINYVITEVRSVTKGQNNGTQDFTIDELVKSYSKQGNVYYKEFYNLRELYSYKTEDDKKCYFYSYTSLEMAMKGTKDNNFKKGEYTYTQEQLESCKQVLERYYKFNQIVEYNKRNANKTIVSAFYILNNRNDFDWKHFFSQCSKPQIKTRINNNWKDIGSMANAKGMIQDIYNSFTRQANFMF